VGVAGLVQITRNAEENETLSRSLFRKMIPHHRLHFNIYPILIQIPCTLYNKPYITSIFFLIFIQKEYFPPYILIHVTFKTNAQCSPRGGAQDIFCNTHVYGDEMTT
jgi:hypothetical protein